MSVSSSEHRICFRVRRVVGVVAASTARIRLQLRLADCRREAVDLAVYVVDIVLVTLAFCSPTLVTSGLTFSLPFSCVHLGDDLLL